MNLFDLEAVITLNSAAYTQGLKDAENKANKFGRTVGKAFGFLTKAVAVAGGAIVVFGKKSIDAATSFESAFTGVRKTVDATEEEYAQLSDWIMDASTKMALSKENIAGTMEIAGQLGVRGVDALEAFTETMVMLGDTTNLNAEEAAGALARFMNITGDAPTDVSKIGSVIVDLGNNFATTEADIVSMATRLASAGTIAGLSSQDILALSTAMSSVGINAEAGGTAMTQTLIAISKAVNSTGADEKEVAKIQSKLEDKTISLKKAQISYNQAVQKSGKNSAQAQKALLSLQKAEKNVQAVQEELTKATSGVSEKLEAFAKVAGLSSQDFAQMWQDKPIDAIQSFIKGLNNLNESGGSVFDTLNELGLDGIRQTNMLQSLALASDMLGGAVDRANTAFEENSALTHEAELRYSTMESQALQTGEAFKNLQVVIGQELTPVYGELMSFARNSMDAMSEGFKTGGLSGFMEALGSSLADGLVGLAGNLPQIIEAGGMLLSALGEGIINSMPEFVQSAATIVQTIGEHLAEKAPEIAPAAVSLLVSLSDEISNQLPTLLTTGEEIVTGLLDGIIQSLPTIMSSVGPLIDFVSKMVTDFANYLTQNTDEIVTAAVTLLTVLVNGLLNNLPMLLKAVIKLTVELVKQLLINLPQILWELVKGIFGILGETVIALGQGLIDLFIGIWEGVVGAFKTEWFQEKWETIKGVFAKVGDWFGEKFTAAKERASEAWSNVKEEFTKKKEAVQEAFSNIGDWFDEHFGGAKEAAVNAWANVKEDFSARYEAVKEAFGDIGDWFSTTFTTAKENASKAWDNAKSVFSKVWDKVKEGFSIEDAFTWGKDMLDNFVKGIKEKVEAVKEAVKGVGQKIKDFIGFSEPKDPESPLHNFHTFAPDMMNLFAQGVKDNASMLKDTMADAFDFEDAIKSPVVSMASAGPGSASPKSGNNYYTLNVNQPVGTPADMMRELRTESQYGLMIGEALA